MSKPKIGQRFIDKSNKYLDFILGTTKFNAQKTVILERGIMAKGWNLPPTRLEERSDNE